MTLTKDISAKFAVAAVAVAMIFTAYAPAASAQTDLQAQITALLAQIQQLEAQLGGTTSAPAGAPAVCPYTWTRDLTMGSEGADVMKLQQFLNANADTRVAAAGSAGSAGMETMYFGPATAAAVSKMQVMYRAEVLTPGGLVNPTGYFGSMSRAKANDLCVADAVVTPTPDTDEDDNGSVTLRGEASLDNFELDDGESTVEEGESDVSIGEITVEFTDGDAEISRMDIALTDENGVREDAWDVFESISLWVDGDMIAEENADDEDDYLNEDDGELRFSNLDLVAMEDDEMEIVVAATLQNNLDADALGAWELAVTSFRFFDADGVAETVNNPAGSDVSEFDIGVAGADEELNISLSSSNPDATDIVVDTDDDTNDVTIMVADLEANDNDIELDRVVVLVETVTGTIDNVIDEVRVVIDGESFRAEPIGTETDFDAAADEDPETGLREGRSERASAAQSVWYLFDIDGDVTIDEGDEVQMEVVVDFKDAGDAGANYANGTTIKASVTSGVAGFWEAEGADDLDADQFDGTAIGDAHVLVAEGILVPVDGFSSETDVLGSDDNIGEFTLNFEVTGVEGNFFITDNAVQADEDNGVRFLVTGIGDGTATAILTSTADEDTSVFEVREGETEEFTLTVTISGAETVTTPRVTLTEVNFTDETDGVVNGGAGVIEGTYFTVPASDFRTGVQTIQLTS